MISIRKKPQVIAQLSNHVLTVFFQSSEPPLLWHYDLDKNHSFTLSLHRQEGEWELGVTVTGGTFQPIAHFDDYEMAENALKAIERALMGETKSDSCGCSHSAKGFIALVMFVLLVGGAAWVGKNYAAPSIKMATVHEAPAAARGETKSVVQDGVPVSADDILETTGR